MNDYYTEQLVKKQTDAKDLAIKVLLILLTALSLATAFFFPFLILLPVIFIALDVIMLRRMDVEYEYLYVNGDLDIDKIMHKEKRKNMMSMNVNDLEVLAPAGAQELMPYKNVRRYNFTTGRADAKIYELVFTAQGEKRKIVFEPGKDLVEGIWMLAPRKVIR